MNKDSKNSQILLFPSVRGLLILRPGESAFVKCRLRYADDLTLPEAKESGSPLFVQSLESAPLILHPEIILPGEPIGVRLSNPTRNVCVLVEDEADISKRLGHGIFRSSAVIPTNRPIARAFRVAQSGFKGECAS